MASGPKVSVLLELVDRLTQPLAGAGSAVRGFGAKLRSLGTEAMDLLNNKLVQGIGLAGMIGGLKKAFEAADELEASMRKLDGTAKITGVPLAVLEGIANKAKDQFKLSAVQANDFAVEMAKLAAKAGDVGKAGPALEAFLNIGAARGLTASETLKAVQQAILGIDEGTDKLFNANPSVLYKEYADAIGTTAGKLTDQQKAQALMTRALQDSTQVGGSYAAYLQSAAGQQELLKNRTREAAATLGLAMAEVRQAVLPLLVTLAEGFRAFIGGIQVMALDLGFAWDGIAPAVKKMAGNVLLTLSGLIGESRVFLTIFGDAATDMANRMGDAGVRMVREAAKAQRNIAAGKELAYAEWAGTQSRGEASLTAIVASGTTARTRLDTEANGDRGKRLAALNDEILVRQVMYEQRMTETQAKAYLQRQRDLGQHVGTQVATIAEGYTRLDGYNTLLAAGFDKGLTPAVQRTTVQVRDLDITARAVPVTLDGVTRGATGAGAAVAGAGEATEKSKESFEKVVRTAGDAAHGLGLIDDAGKGVVNTMLNVGSAISDAIKGGWTAGGVIGVVAGVGSLLKGLFGGKSPAQLAAERELRKNTETIAENSRRVGDLTRLSSSGGKLASVQSVLAGLGDAISDLGGKGGGALGDRVRQGRFTGILAGALSGVGLGIGDLDSVAKDLGITIRNSEGAFIVQGLRDLLALLGEIEPTKFAETFEGAREKLRSEVDLFDLSDAEQARRLAAIAGGALGSGVLGQRLGGLDFGTAEGRAAGLDAIRQMFTDLPGLSAGDLGGLTGSQFLEVLQDLKALLSADLPETIATGVTDALEGATGGLGDVAPTDTPAPSVSLADLVATATRSESYLASIADYTSVLPTLTAPAGVARPGAVPAITVTIGDVTIQGGAGGRADGEAFVEYVSTELARQLAEVQRARGSAER